MKKIKTILQHLQSKLSLFYKVLTQLPLSHLISLLFYRLKKLFGMLIILEDRSIEAVDVRFFDFDLTNALNNSREINQKIIDEADLHLTGKIKLFGVIETNLAFENHSTAKHWTSYQGDQFDGKDIKFTWEPARFSWAITLGQAYQLTNEEKYADFLWKQIEAFFLMNPANLGVHWISAQEVAMRIITLSYSFSLVKDAISSTEERIKLFSKLIESHAKRIPSTLGYAKAQNNNHLISEAVGLYTAGTVLPTHSMAAEWKKIGLKLFEKAIQSQIKMVGSYSQHSTRYHRLMLELVNWMRVMMNINEEILSTTSTNLIEASILWLKHLCNPLNGYCPNLGPNDGAYLMPFKSWDLQDFRPTLQASCALFFNQSFFNNMESNLCLDWLGLDRQIAVFDLNTIESQKLNPIVIQGDNSYAYLRAERFTNRPGHADQNHLDLWYQNENVLLDPGTYLYNAEKPWNNSLSDTFYHNTLTINQKNQMTRGGKFLWLDWAQAKKIETYTNSEDEIISASAEHNGYESENVVHQRIVDVKHDEWLIKDTLFQKSAKKEGKAVVGYHLLIKNPLSFDVDGNSIIFCYKNFSMQFSILGFDIEKLSLVQAGKTIFGRTIDNECYGWYAPTYAVKKPAISVVCEQEFRLPTEIISKLKFDI